MKIIKSVIILVLCLLQNSCKTDTDLNKIKVGSEWTYKIIDYPYSTAYYLEKVIKMNSPTHYLIEYSFLNFYHEIDTVEVKWSNQNYIWVDFTSTDTLFVLQFPLTQFKKWKNKQDIYSVENTNEKVEIGDKSYNCWIIKKTTTMFRPYQSDFIYWNNKFGIVKKKSIPNERGACSWSYELVEFNQ